MKQIDETDRCKRFIKYNILSISRKSAAAFMAFLKYIFLEDN